MAESSVTSLPKVNGSITNNDYFLLERSNVAYALTGEQLYKYVEDSAKHVEKGAKGDKGDKGDTYTLTDADRTEVAEKIIKVSEDFNDDNPFTQMMIDPTPVTVNLLTSSDKITKSMLSDEVLRDLEAGKPSPGADTALRVIKENGEVLSTAWKQMTSTDAEDYYSDYPYRAAVSVENVKSYMIPEVIFGIEEIQQGIYAPIANAFNGGVYLYASSQPTERIVIPTMIFWG